MDLVFSSKGLPLAHELLEQGESDPLSPVDMEDPPGGMSVSPGTAKQHLRAALVEDRVKQLTQSGRVVEIRMESFKVCLIRIG